MEERSDLLAVNGRLVTYLVLSLPNAHLTVERGALKTLDFMFHPRSPPHKQVMYWSYIASRGFGLSLATYSLACPTVAWCAFRVGEPDGRASAFSGIHHAAALCPKAEIFYSSQLHIHLDGIAGKRASPNSAEYFYTQRVAS
jgi:hypothetical protein